MRDYKTVRPVGQFDNMACWAASIEWWRTYMSPKYAYKSQIEIASNPQLKGFIHYSDDEEDLSSGGFYHHKSELLFHAEGMRSETFAIGEFTAKKLEKLLRTGPIVIIYDDHKTPGNYHANVIIEWKGKWGVGYYVAMEPRNGGSFENRFIDWYQRSCCYVGYAKS